MRLVAPLLALGLLVGSADACPRAPCVAPSYWTSPPIAGALDSTQDRANWHRAADFRDNQDMCLTEARAEDAAASRGLFDGAHGIVDVLKRILDMPDWLKSRSRAREAAVEARRLAEENARAAAEIEQALARLPATRSEPRYCRGYACASGP